MSELSKAVEALEQTVRAQEEEIQSLKYSIVTLTRERDDYKHLFSMYRNAWLREIGGVIRNKTHEIDGFVLRTREVYEGYQKWVAYQKHLDKQAKEDAIT